MSRLKQVVLPAPLGPISAWIVPRAHREVTSLTATKPLNSFVRPRVSRMMSSAMAVGRGLHCRGGLARRASSSRGQARIIPIAPAWQSKPCVIACRLQRARAFRGTRRCPRRRPDRRCCTSSPRTSTAYASPSGRSICAIERALAERHHRRASRDDPVGERRDRGVELGRRRRRGSRAPSRAPSRASISSPVTQHLHHALARDVARRRRRAGVEQKRPTLTPRQREARVVGGDGEVAHRRPAGSRPRSRCRARARSPAAAARVSFSIMRLQASNSSRCHAGVGVRAHLLQVVAGAEALAGAGDARRRARPRRPPTSSSSRCSAASMSRRQRVEALAAVQRQRAHAAARRRAARTGSIAASTGAFIARLLFDRRRRAGALAQQELLDLAGRGLRQLAEHDALRHLEPREMRAAVRDQLAARRPPRPA